MTLPSDSFWLGWLCGGLTQGLWMLYRHRREVAELRDELRRRPPLVQDVVDPIQEARRELLRRGKPDVVLLIGREP